MELQEIVDNFLSGWEHSALVDGVLLTGSRSAGNDSENSDIDLQILLQEETFRERGNQIVDGILVEYFANPTAFIFNYLEQERNAFHRPTIRMYATGIILFDRDGTMARACSEAKRLLKLPVPAMTAAEVEAAKYSIWDCLDDLQAPYRTGDASFPYVFHLNLNKVLTLYNRYCGAELTAPSKQLAQFSKASFRDKYGIDDFPDKIFAELFLTCLFASTAEEMYASFDALVNHAIEAMGGFKIDGWRSRIDP